MTEYNNSLVDTDADSMWKEIEGAEKARESALVNYDTLLTNIKATEDWPEAFSFQYLSYMVPRIVLENPTVRVSSQAGGDDLVVDQALAMLEQALMAGMVDPDQALMMLDEIEKPHMNALASQYGLKRWIEQEDLRAHLDRQCDLYLKGVSISQTYTGRVRGDDSKRWPKACVIEPRRFLIDPLAMQYSERAWSGHWYPIPKPKLEAKAKNDGEGGWDMTAIADLTTQADDRAGVDRKEVRVYEIHVLNYDMNEAGDPDINGTIFTYGAKKDGEACKGIEIRKPRPAFVPPWGPYTLFGCYNRLSAWPMSPLLATFMQQDELQKHAKAMNVNARQYRRLVLCSSANQELIQKLQSAPDMLVLPVNDEQFDKSKVEVIEIGGISDQQLEMYAMMRKAIDRAIGMDDSQRGRVDSDATATAVAVADESVATRVSYIEGKFIAGVRQLLRSVLWYMVMDERVSFRLGKEVSKELNMIDPWFQGGLTSGEKFDFDDLEMVIDPYSMGRVSEQALQQRVSTFVESLIAMGQAMLTMPFIDWRLVVRSLTQVLNLPGLDQAIDFEMLKQIGQMQSAMGMQAMTMSADGAGRFADDQKAKSGGQPMSNSQHLINNRVGGNAGNLQYKGAAA